MRRTAQLLGAKSTGYSHPFHFAKDGGAAAPSKRLSELHMQAAETKAFKAMRAEMSGRMQQYGPGQQVQANGYFKHFMLSEPHNYHKPENVHVHKEVQGETPSHTSSTVVSPAAFWSLGFVFWFISFFFGPNPSPYEFMRPDRDALNPRLQPLGGGLVEWGPEPLSNPKNPFTGDLCVIKDLPNRDDYKPIHGCVPAH